MTWWWCDLPRRAASPNYFDWKCSRIQCTIHSGDPQALCLQAQQSRISVTLSGETIAHPQGRPQRLQGQPSKLSQHPESNISAFPTHKCLDLDFFLLLNSSEWQPQLPMIFSWYLPLQNLLWSQSSHSLKLYEDCLSSHTGWRLCLAGKCLSR